jgi:hypothetical protein
MEDEGSKLCNTCLSKYLPVPLEGESPQRANAVQNIVRRANVAIQDIAQQIDDEDSNQAPVPAKPVSDLMIGYATYYRDSYCHGVTMCQTTIKGRPLLTLRSEDVINFLYFETPVLQSFKEMFGDGLVALCLLPNGLCVQAPNRSKQSRLHAFNGRQLKNLIKSKWQSFFDKTLWGVGTFNKRNAAVLTLSLDTGRVLANTVTAIGVDKQKLLS